MTKLKSLLSIALIFILGSLKAQIATDSLLYPLDNNTGNGTLFNFTAGDISEVGQYFTIPTNQQNAQVTGVIIFFGSKSQVGASDVYSISMYNAGVDSLPTGTAVGTTTYTTANIDTAGAINTFNFANPINVTNNRFVIGVEIAAPAKNDTNNIISNTQGDGLGLRRSLVKLNNNATIWQTFVNTWQKLEDVFLFPNTTDPIDVDFLILPIYRFNKNPFAQFTASSTNVTVGQTVNLNNTSTGTPTPTYSWSITPTTFTYMGGTNATSVNPIVQFTAPGTYSVALTATNSNNTDVQNRINYIVVSGSGGSVNACDTLFNFGLNDTLRIFTIPAPPQSVGGFQAGHNGFGDISKADKFSLPFPNTELRAATLFFGVAMASSPTKTIKVRVWNDTGVDGDGNLGAPGSILAEQDVTISSIPTGGAPLNITFNPPIVLTTNYFIGISYTYAAGDSVALFLNADGETLPGTAYEEWGPASVPPLWYPYFSGSTWQTNQSHFILADICVACNISFNAVTFNDNTSCAAPNGSISVTSNGGTAPKQYSINGSPFQPSPLFSNLPAGTYNIVCEDADGCSIDTTIVLNDNLNLPFLSSNSINANQSCVTPFDGSFNLNIAQGSAPYTYSVVGPNSFSQNGQALSAGNVLFSNLNGGTYNLTVIDASSCSEVISVVVPNNAPTISVTEVSVTPNTACGAGNGAFEVEAGAGSFTFSIPGQSNATGVFSGLAAGTYSVTATSTGTGCQGTLSVVVPENAFALNLIENFALNNTACVAPYNGEFSVTSTNGQAPFNYSTTGLSNTNGTFTGLEAGTYSVTANDANGCSGTISVIIADNAITLNVSATLPTTPNTACVSPYNGSVSFTTSNGALPINYELNGQFNTTGTFSDLNSGSVTVIVRDNDGCEGTATAIIDDQSLNPDVLVISVAPNAACAAPFDGAFSLNANGNGQIFTFEVGGVQNNTGVFTDLSPGQYDVTVTDAVGCSSVESVVVADNAPSLTVQVASNSDNTACSGTGNGSFTLTATGGTAPYNFNTGSALNQTGTFNGLSGGAFNVTVTDANGCEGNISVSVANSPATVTLTDTTINASTSTSTDGSATIIAAGGTPPYTYNWSNGGTAATISNVAWGDYDVTVTDANGCVATATVTVSFSVGIDQAILAAEIKVFPNPSTGIVNIEILLNENKNVLVDAYNVLGENVLKIESKNTLEYNEKLNFQNFSNGVYLIKIQIGNESIMKRIFITHP